MGKERITRRVGLFGAINVGGKTTVRGIKVGTVAVDPGSIGATTKGATAVTITGIEVGDFVTLMPPSGLNDDLLPAGCYISADDTLQLLIYNPTGGALDDGEFTWTYLWLDVT